MTTPTPQLPSLGTTAQAEFCQEMVEHLRAGLPVTEGLASLARGARSGRLRRTAAALRDAVARGQSLSDAMAAAGPAFPAAFVDLVRAAEPTGGLPDVFGCMLRESLRQKRLHGRLRGALLHPIIALWAAVAVVVAVEVLALPRMSAIFRDLGAEIPGLTEWLLDFSGLLLRYWWVFLFLAAACLVLQVRFYFRSDFGGPTWRALGYLPPFRNYFRYMNSATFLGMASELLRHGVAFPEALGLAGAALVGDEAHRDARHAREMAESGATPEQASRFLLFVPDEARELLQSLVPATPPAQAMADVAEYYDRRLEKSEIDAVFALEPFLFLMLILVIGIMVIAMYLPLFNIGKAIR